MERLCFICETPLTSVRSQIKKKTMTCSTDCGVILRDINIHNKVFACEIQSFIDWSVGYKTDIQSLLDWSVGWKEPVKAIACWQCYQFIGVRPSAATQRFCDRCSNYRNKTSAIKSKTNVNQTLEQKRKNNAIRARARHKRRTLEADGEVIDLYQLAERDEWQCKLCSMPVDQNNKHSRGNLHLMGPSLDHIIPVSKGGSHTWNNVQLAHFMCNSLRGNKDLVR